MQEPGGWSRTASDVEASCLAPLVGALTGDVAVLTAVVAPGAAASAVAAAGSGREGKEGGIGRRWGSGAERGGV